MGSQCEGTSRTRNTGSVAYSGSAVSFSAGNTAATVGESGSEGISAVNSNRARCFGVFPEKRRKKKKEKTSVDGWIVFVDAYSYGDLFCIRMSIKFGIRIGLLAVYERCDRRDIDPRDREASHR